MKHTFFILPAFLIFLGCSNASQSRDSTSTTTSVAAQNSDPRSSQVTLPDSALAFIQQYFGANALHHVVEKKSPTPEGTFYEATLTDGTEIDFGKAGNWIEANAEEPNRLPTGFFPETIQTYLKKHFANIGVESIDKDQKGYELELTDGVNLHFDPKGSFLRQEK